MLPPFISENISNILKIISIYYIQHLQYHLQNQKATNLYRHFFYLFFYEPKRTSGCDVAIDSDE